ncbi:MAG: L-idonate 5-dehydrogenase [Acidimicrobiales bacterium]
MRACVLYKAGDLRVEDRPQHDPGVGEIAIAIAVGGICGSDMHYYQRGSVGDFRVIDPMVLGHEVVGTVHNLGPDVDGPPPGTPVAIHPATPCGNCRECTSGLRNICPNTLYLGSAARRPHVQGGLAEVINVPVAQVRRLPDTVDFNVAVLAEPLAVAIHAVRRAGEVNGRTVLVVGAGPIGCLVVAVLTHAGASEIVVADVLDAPLKLAKRVGANSIVRADDSNDPAWPSDVDIAIEASGTGSGLRTCVERLRRGGTLVMLGLLPPGETGFLGNVVVTRELSLRGAFRFDAEFDESLALLADGLDVAPIVTDTFPLAKAVEAFHRAADRSLASKVVLDLRR